MLRVKVIPRSPKTEFAGTLADGTLKIRLAAPPEKGRANEALIAFLAEKYQTQRSSIQIVSGHTSPQKLIRINEPRP